MRVVLLGDFPVNSTHIRGGVQAAYSYLVKGLAKLSDLEIHVVTFGSPNWTGVNHAQYDGVKFHTLPVLPRFERLRNYRKYRTDLKHKLTQIKPDLVHVQEAGADAFVALQLKYPTVVTAHGIRREDSKYYRSWKQRLRFYYDSAIIERAVLHRARHLIAISRYVIEYFSPLLQTNAQVFYIPNAIDERFFELSNNVNNMTVLFTGRVIPLKRVMDLVRAFANVVSQIPSAQLHIAGECTSDVSYSESIHDWIIQNGLEDHIYLLGELNQNEILTEYAQCSVFILSSAQENAPMVIAQAMAAGKPVISTNVGGVGEMIGVNNERGLLVNVGDINGLSNAILHMLKDPRFQSLLGQAGHTFALENYHQDRVAQRTYEVYKQIVTGE